ncbi:TonB-dependent receptor [Lacihabitans lacunae]|uniref:Carboxypeptidase-like regulatory domain-containing protein n=1 Tax=Lacihabitans lacunae TaxID=1028214 RepID=A0ABV7Z3L1_9BACT
MRILILILLTTGYVHSQTIKGRVIDLETKQSLPFANVQISGVNVTAASQADSSGYFKFNNLAIGRYDLRVSYVGYETYMQKSILLLSGKQQEIQVTMQSNYKELEELVIKSEKETLQDISSKKISVEQTSRYAATWGDPARMALSFAGVSTVNDQTNELVIRGNSPKGLLWLIDGVEVPNPNHFASDGASGGLISVLNVNTLKNSTFYTGAFPANYGNATSGVFDVRLREGNNQAFENSINVNILGLDFSTEGPISKRKKSSFLYNYRFSNTKLINTLGLSSVFQAATPKYQDMVFKLNFPSKNNNYSLWGIYGNNTTNFTLESFLEIDNRANFYASGFNWARYINKERFLETTLSFSGNENINNQKSIGERIDENRISELKYNYLRLNTNFTQKIKSNTTLQLGGILSNLSYNLNGFFDTSIKEINLIASDVSLKGRGNTIFYQNYVSLRYRNSLFDLNVGLHNTNFFLNNSSTLEPRVRVKYKNGSKQSFDLAIGYHSRLEPLSIYLFKNNLLLNGNEVSNKELKSPRALHFVLGYTYILANNWKLNSEVYYQKNMMIGVVDTALVKGIENYTLINQTNSVNLLPLNSIGIGKNYGWELSLEKSLRKGIYFLYTTSIFRSKYALNSNDYYKSTRFDNRYVVNLLGGKEWQIKKNIFSINLKNCLAGGIRVQPSTVVNNSVVQDSKNGYSEKLRDYQRTDIKFAYIINFSKVTAQFSMDINNVTNRKNPLLRVYNPVIKNFETINQLGLLPVLGFRLNF